ncbi:MAG: malonic semialdehyde reductase [Rickettsiaceae bacterium]
MRTIKDVFSDRTCYKFKNTPLTEELLKEIYDLMKLGPTSSNSCPLRIIFVQSLDAKSRLEKCLMEGNIAKVRSAPVTALFAYDPKFYNKMDILNPVAPQFKTYFATSKKAAIDTATRNSTLQAAYFMIAARGLGLDCGPMSGFNSEAIEKEFLAGTGLKINFICNLGYKDQENPYPRLPRLDFSEVCKVV